MVMSFQCVKCVEAWDFEDYVCPCCGSAAVDPRSRMPLSLKYKFFKKDGKDVYYVIRLSTGKSVFDEPDNYLNDD
jgi:hypothetical protein